MTLEAIIIDKISIIDEKSLIIPPLPNGGGGYTVLPLSVRPSKIFLVAFFSVTVDGSYMARSSLTYIPGFSVKFFFQPIYTDYAN